MFASRTGEGYPYAGATETAPTASRNGYDFLGWFNGQTKVIDADGKLVANWATANDVTLVANWEAKAVNYQVKHIYAGYAGTFEGEGVEVVYSTALDGSTTSAEASYLTATADSKVTASVVAREGFESPAT
ncbi:MAG: hypothetical protein J6J24_01100, partial [Clostridia bacterium]|nr:hypothetical protein [Clostridia bacterium]